MSVQLLANINRVQFVTNFRCLAYKLKLIRPVTSSSLEREKLRGRRSAIGLIVLKIMILFLNVDSRTLSSCQAKLGCFSAACFNILQFYHGMT